MGVGGKLWYRCSSIPSTMLQKQRTENLKKSTSKRLKHQNIIEWAEAVVPLLQHTKHNVTETKDKNQQNKLLSLKKKQKNKEDLKNSTSKKLKHQNVTKWEEAVVPLLQHTKHNATETKDRNQQNKLLSLKKK